MVFVLVHLQLLFLQKPLVALCIITLKLFLIRSFFVRCAPLFLWEVAAV